MLFETAEQQLTYDILIDQCASNLSQVLYFGETKSEGFGLDTSIEKSRMHMGSDNVIGTSLAATFSQS